MCECAFSLSGSRSNESTRPNAGLCVFFFFSYFISYIIHIPLNVTRTKLLYVSMVEWKRIQSRNTIQRIVYFIFCTIYELQLYVKWLKGKKKKQCSGVDASSKYFILIFFGGFSGVRFSVQLYLIHCVILGLIIFFWCVRCVLSKLKKWMRHNNFVPRGNCWASNIAVNWIQYAWFCLSFTLWLLGLVFRGVCKR